MIQSRAEVVQIAAVSLSTGEATEEPWFGVAVNGRFGSAIVRSARSLDELAGLVGDLRDQRALWLFVQAQDPSIGTFDGEPIDPLSQI